MKPRKKRRAPKRRKQPQRKKRPTPQRRRLPINLTKAKSVPDSSGFLIIQLKPGVVSKDAQSLDEVAQEFSLDGIATLLKKYKLPSRRLITSVSVEQLLELEERARKNEFAPRVSLASYWRLDARTVPEPERQNILNQFLELQNEVDSGYLEKSASAPARAPANPFEPEQLYLNAEPIGINARWAWTKPGGTGTGMRFVDLEEGWFLQHEDFPKGLGVVFNGISNSVFIRHHGTAVLGEIAGLDNSRGIIGIARDASVSLVSHFEAVGGTNGHVADAIYAALALNPLPHVLLLEVQRGNPELPTEVEDADFFAIKYAVALGVIVIEAAGNGGFDLDGLNRLNRKSPNFRDSGAIFAGAASSAMPHERLLESNFGSRLDCYAWGENIVSTGYGDRNPGTPSNNKRYTKAFGGTSGASAIIAGAALLVQGCYLTNHGTLLRPDQMRNTLSTTGTPQGGKVGGNIGIMPDLQRIIP
jgi:serine protease